MLAMVSEQANASFLHLLFVKVCNLRVFRVRMPYLKPRKSGESNGKIWIFACFQIWPVLWRKSLIYCYIDWACTWLFEISLKYITVYIIQTWRERSEDTLLLLFPNSHKASRNISEVVWYAWYKLKFRDWSLNSPSLPTLLCH